MQDLNEMMKIAPLERDRKSTAQPFPGFTPLPMFNPNEEEDVCCGPPPAPKSSVFEKPGYLLCHFVAEFLETPVGPVPKVKSVWEKQDYWGTAAARLGHRSNYKISPGLYAVGHPDKNAPVLVTANYKLTFDVLRRDLDGLNCWILVLDTRGINVWCAAGKRFFSTDELVRTLRLSRLERVVDHRRLIVPQFGATGVAAGKVKKESGFEVIWGPIYSKYLKVYLESGGRITPEMRTATFTFRERLVLIPLELVMSIKPVLLIGLIIFALSGFGSGIFSFSNVWERGATAAFALLAALFTGIVLGPALLPWIPGTAFSIKGALTGILGWLTVIWVNNGSLVWMESVGLFFFMMSLSSYLTMNFTGSTPFTSPSGVEKEMRAAIPLQLSALFLALIFWMVGGFMR